MAITSAWTAENTASYAPTGATIPTVTNPVSSYNTIRGLTYDALGTLDNATQTAAFTAIGDALKTYFDASVDTLILGLDAAATINVRLVIEDIDRMDTGYSEIKTNQYTVSVNVFRVTYRVEWAVA